MLDLYQHTSPDVDAKHLPHNTISRQVSFADRLSLVFRGTISRNAITLGDVDNDGDIELIVGSAEGVVAIFKGDSKVIWRYAKRLGVVTHVLVGDITNIGKNSLIAITAEGLCFVFSDMTASTDTIITPTLIDLVPCNVSTAIVADLDGDGLNELVLGTGNGEVFSLALLPLEQSAPSPNERKKETNPEISRKDLLLKAGSESLEDLVVQSQASYNRLSNLLGSDKKKEEQPVSQGSFGKLANLISAAQASEKKSEQNNVVTSPTVSKVLSSEGTPIPQRKTEDTLSHQGSLRRFSNFAALAAASLTESKKQAEETAQPKESKLDESSPILKRKKSVQFKETKISPDLTRGNESLPSSSNTSLQQGMNRTTSSSALQKSPQPIIKKSSTLESPSSAPSQVAVPRITFVREHINRVGTFSHQFKKKKSWRFSNEITYLLLIENENFEPALYIGISNSSDKCVDMRGTVVESIETSSSTSFMSQRKGPLLDSRGKTDLHALCASDGTLKLVHGNRSVWELHVDHELFALNLLDITADGSDEIITCAWDGMTYIVDHSKNVVKFKFSDAICAFVAGNFSITPGSKATCFIYATFENEIVIYYDIHLRSIHSSTIITLMKDQIDDFYSLKENPSSLEWTRTEQASLFHSCLSCDDNSEHIQTYKEFLEAKLDNLLKQNGRLEERITYHMNHEAEIKEEAKRQQKEKKKQRQQLHPIIYYMVLSGIPNVDGEIASWIK